MSGWRCFGGRTGRLGILLEGVLEDESQAVLDQGHQIGRRMQDHGGFQDGHHRPQLPAPLAPAAMPGVEVEARAVAPSAAGDQRPPGGRRFSSRHLRSSCPAWAVSRERPFEMPRCCSEPGGNQTSSSQRSISASSCFSWGALEKSERRPLSAKSADPLAQPPARGVRRRKVILAPGVKRTTLSRRSTCRPSTKTW